MQFFASCAWKGADLTAQSVAPLLSRNARRPQSLQSAFPRLFEEPATDDRPEWMRIRDHMLRVAEQHRPHETREG